MRFGLVKMVIQYLREKYIDKYFDSLDQVEKKKAMRIKNKKVYNQFVISHGLLRKALGIYQDKMPEEFLFSYTKHEKPFLKDKKIYFNVSHSGDYLLIGFSKKMDIGVDIEKIISSRNYKAILKRFFKREKLPTL